MVVKVKRDHYRSHVGTQKLGYRCSLNHAVRRGLPDDFFVVEAIFSRVAARKNTSGFFLSGTIALDSWPRFL